MSTARERGQRVRRETERKRGKPRIGRPRGRVKDSRTVIMEWYGELRKQGHSEGIAGALIRNQLGEVITDIMFQTWGQVTHKQHHRHPKSGRYVKRDTI